jgi:hypothetical protein
MTRHRHLALTSSFHNTRPPATQAKFNHKGQFKSLRIPLKGTPTKSKKIQKKYLKNHKSKIKKKKTKMLQLKKGLFKHFEILKIPLWELRSKHLACPPISLLFLNRT